MDNQLSEGYTRQWLSIRIGYGEFDPGEGKFASLSVPGGL